MADPAAGAGPGSGEGLLGTLAAIARELPALVSDRVELLALELQRAGRALAQIVALLVAVAVLGVTAWLVLWAGLVGAMVAAGLALHWALLVALLLNGVAIVLVALRVARLLPLLRLPATRRHLTLAPAPEPPPPARHERNDAAAAAP